MNLDEHGDAVAPRENDMLQEVVALASVKVCSIMVPRVDMAACDVREGRDKLLSVMQQRRHTKIPVYENDVDHIVGLVHARDLYINPGQDSSEMVRPVDFVPEQMTADKLLAHFRDSRTQFAIVLMCPGVPVTA